MTDILAKKDVWHLRKQLLIQSYVNSQNKGTREIDFTSGSVTLTGENDQDMLFWQAITYGVQNGDIATGGTETEPMIDLNNDGVFDLGLAFDEVNKCFILTVISNEIGDSYTYKLSDAVAAELKADCGLGGIEEYYDAYKLIFSKNKRIPGDANDDKSVDVKDVTLVKQKLAHWNVTLV